jgi:hypothetical protein
MHFRFTIILIALCAVLMPTTGQNSSQNSLKSAAPACPVAKDLVNTDLFGAWVLELQSAAGAAVSTRLTMERNPEFAESLAGHFMQGSVRYEVFGDIEDGALDLEESNNGKDIIAIWKGRVSEGSCGQAITGTRRFVATQAEQRFVLRRAGW